jgi:hypothetical protein
MTSSALSLECTRILLSLQYQLTARLSFAPVEPPSVIFSPADFEVGRIEAPSCPTTSLSISCVRKRVRLGHAAEFIIAPTAAIRSVVDLGSLASVALVDAYMHFPDAAATEPGFRPATAAAVSASPPLHAKLLPVSYMPSAPHGGVLVRVPIPASTPDGTDVLIRRASVGGCDMALDGPHLRVSVGFNHALSPRGPVYEAADSGDAPTLLHLLDGGASTEELGSVRACGVSQTAT